MSIPASPLKVNHSLRIISASFGATGERIRVRCISEKKPRTGAKSVKPTLEDAYLWLLKENNSDDKGKVKIEDDGGKIREKGKRIKEKGKRKTKKEERKKRKEERRRMKDKKRKPASSIQ